LFGRMLCAMGSHKRSRGRARRQGASWVSRCRRCGVPMRRTDSGDWEVDERQTAAVSASGEPQPAREFDVAAPVAERPPAATDAEQAKRRRTRAVKPIAEPEPAETDDEPDAGLARKRGFALFRRGKAPSAEQEVDAPEPAPTDLEEDLEPMPEPVRWRDRIEIPQIKLRRKRVRD
jgi:hypothetical protein